MKEAILATYNLDETTLNRLFDDFMSIHNQELNHWIQKQHLQLQRLGLSNENIYQKIIDELPKQRFTAPMLSARQIRRIIYG